MLAQRFRVEGGAGVEHKAGGDVLGTIGTRDAGHRGLAYRGVAKQGVFHLARKDIKATGDDDLFNPAD